MNTSHGGFGQVMIGGTRVIGLSVNIWIVFPFEELMHRALWMNYNQLYLTAVICISSDTQPHNDAACRRVTHRWPTQGESMLSSSSMETLGRTAPNRADFAQMTWTTSITSQRMKEVGRVFLSKKTTTYNNKLVSNWLVGLAMTILIGFLLVIPFLTHQYSTRTCSQRWLHGSPPRLARVLARDGGR